MTSSNSKLPKRTNSQKSGEIAAEALGGNLIHSCNVIPIPQSRDLGIDVKCEVMKGDYPTGLEFNAQCKGIKTVNVKQSFISINSIKVTTVGYWLQQRSPTFLFVYCLRSRNFFWCFPAKYLFTLSKKWQSQDTVTIRVPTSNSFSQDSTALPIDLLEIVKSEDSFQKINDMREEMKEKQGQYEAELEYMSNGRYQEIQADLLLDESKAERRNGVYLDSFAELLLL